MQLSYRGAHYEAQQPNLQESNTEQIGTYRGARVQRKHFKLSQAYHGQVQLTYRGAKYNHEV
ncbi:DUF4278 domain-containing protein [Pseudanabaena sp. FACHB-2040]|uniref:DUF4278 domain-containing protein n=1 Tax=Pseudanabaena sp. FACHB-2040 TaxID=2692859 RepID=UPI001685DAA7|nr:DUF4278 domain-containing protein [Pseudanabaena sp. FACHB-2040]MBD2256852.1 DUF4278 domain-containing protein [Pseudanabaena sp. FACHB-2040]